MYMVLPSNRDALKPVCIADDDHADAGNRAAIDNDFVHGIGSNGLLFR